MNKWNKLETANLHCLDLLQRSNVHRRSSANKGLQSLVFQLSEHKHVHCRFQHMYFTIKKNDPFHLHFSAFPNFLETWWDYKQILSTSAIFNMQQLVACTITIMQ